LFKKFVSFVNTVSHTFPHTDTRPALLFPDPDLYLLDPREVTLLHVTFLMLWTLASSFHQGDRIKVMSFSGFNTLAVDDSLSLSQACLFVKKTDNP
jgi:hypothetical protein